MLYSGSIRTPAVHADRRQGHRKLYTVDHVVDKKRLRTKGHRE